MKSAWRRPGETEAPGIARFVLSGQGGQDGQDSLSGGQGGGQGGHYGK